jgi:hypothetical protein
MCSAKGCFRASRTAASGPYRLYMGAPKRPFTTSWSRVSPAVPRVTEVAFDPSLRSLRPSFTAYRLERLNGGLKFAPL